MKSTAHKCHDLFESGQQRSVVLANAGAQETPVILHAYLTACQKVCNRRNRFCAATGARTNCQDQIAERKSGARFDNLAKFAVPFHILSIFALSKSNATSRCEYFFHRHSLVIQFLSTLELTAERHFCSILEHRPSPALRRGQASSRPRRVRPVTRVSRASSIVERKFTKRQISRLPRECLSTADG